MPDGSKKNIAQNDTPVKKNTFPRIRGGDLKGKRRMVFLPGRLATDRKAAADEKIRLYKFDGKSLCKTPYCNI